MESRQDICGFCRDEPYHTQAGTHTRTLACVCTHTHTHAHIPSVSPGRPLEGGPLGGHGDETNMEPDLWRSLCLSLLKGFERLRSRGIYLT